MKTAKKTRAEAKDIALRWLANGGVASDIQDFGIPLPQECLPVKRITIFGPDRVDQVLEYEGGFLLTLSSRSYDNYWALFKERLRQEKIAAAQKALKECGIDA